MLGILSPPPKASSSVGLDMNSYGQRRPNRQRPLHSSATPLLLHGFMKLDNIQELLKSFGKNGHRFRQTTLQIPPSMMMKAQS